MSPPLECLWWCRGYTLIMSRYAALREHDDTSSADHIIVLHDLTWEDYERPLEIRGDRSVPRISYLEGEGHS